MTLATAEIGLNETTSVYLSFVSLNFVRFFFFAQIKHTCERSAQQKIACFRNY